MKQILTTALYFIFLIVTPILHAGAKDEAGLNIEPFAGYYNGEIKSETLTDGAIRSYVVGARISYVTQSAIGYGLEYSQSSGNLADDTSVSWNTKDIGAFVRYNLTDWLAVSATYLADWRVEADEDPVRELITGDGYNAGLSFALTSFFKVNVDHQIRNIKKMGSDDLTGDTFSTVMISTVVPINFPYKFN
jgi:hypothetical protein